MKYRVSIRGGHLGRAIATCALIVAVAACDSSAADDDDDDDDSTIDAGPDAFVPPPGSFTVEWGPFDVDSTDESTRCVTRRLGNDAPLHIGSIHNVLGATSHHLIVYRVADETEVLEPVPCDPFTDALDPAKGSPLMITQKQEETLELPEGVAFTLEANQMVRLEMHYLNATDETQTVTATSTFIQLPDAEFEHEADFLFIGNPDIDLGPGESTLGPSYFPVPAELDGKNVFAITGHEHQWGTGVTVATAEGPGDPDTTVYAPENFSWSEPETVYHDPPFVIPPGGGFRFTCEYDNQSGGNVGFGESTEDEMCFFWAYYYPSVGGGRVCIHTEQAGGQDLCCPGNALCDFILGQL
jgi:hypothetical protein